MRHYNIFIGSKSYFEQSIREANICDEAKYFLDLIKESDTLKQARQVFTNYADVLILKNDNYHGIVETAHDRLGPLIEELTTDDAIIYIHNPSRVLREYLDELFNRQEIDLTEKKEPYSIQRDASKFVSNIKEISSHIFGQELAIEAISKTMWYLTSVERKKPYVIMLYGHSSLGKTELVREIARCFFDGKYLEKHLSMFKNNNYSEYFFGNQPNRRSMGFDLLERESNLVFFDELDKCPEHFYSAFYTLFDNTTFKDSTYDVDTSGIIIVLTSNYQSIAEMKANLGLPIFYRIDKMIHFEDFSTEDIHRIVMNEIESRKCEYEGKLTPESVYAAVSPNIETKGENARTIKYKVQEVIEDLLFQEIKNQL